MGLNDVQSTVMSILCGAALTDEAARRIYLERFCDQYTQPLVDYLRFARAVPLEAAEDIIQDFWTVKLLAPGPTQNLIAKYLVKRAENSVVGFRQYLGGTTNLWSLQAKRGSLARS